MRLPEKLMGYVEYEGVNYPFNFDKVSFMITLFPPSIEHHRQTNSLAEYLADVSRYDKSTSGFNKRRFLERRRKTIILFSPLRMRSVIITAFSAFLLFGIAVMLARPL